VRLVIIAGSTAMLLTLVGTPVLIRILQRRGYSQAIRESHDGINYPEHQRKRGTPSMGGLAILLAVVGGYGAAHVVTWTPPSASAMVAFALVFGLGAVGVADDYLKIFKQRSTGVRARTKLIGQAVSALVFGVLVLRFPDEEGLTPATQALSVIRDTAIVLPIGLFLLWIWFLVTATTNGVNLTDGLDGLVSGAATMTFAAYTLMSVWQFGQRCSEHATTVCYDLRDPFDMAVFAAAFAGACFGFLWWNTSPARIFMGDTGSLAIGGGVAALAVLSHTQLLLPLLAGLFVLITLSVIAQVGSFKLTGKRVLRMAPLHHHFELLGWHEVTIVVRFWLIHGVAVALGMALFYAEWVRQ
jgi:phospho-N-acetylmuramoyl-pentapeptide-transferase